MARTPIKKRDPAQERKDFDALRSVSPYDAVIKDITSGVQELGRQGKAAIETIKTRFRKLKAFTR